MTLNRSGRALRYETEGKPVEPSVYITLSEIAQMARLSRRQIDRLRQRRVGNFPTEYELGSRLSKNRRCPRFKLAEVEAWLNSRALW